MVKESEPASTAAETQWLDSEQMAAWLELLKVLVFLPSALDAQLERDAGLSQFEYQVLAMLSMSPERTARMVDLAQLSNSSASRLSHVAKRLESSGWLTRRPDPDSARSILATLTADGWKKVVETAPGHVAAVQHYVFEQLRPSQVRELTKICSAISAVTAAADA